MGVVDLIPGFLTPALNCLLMETPRGRGDGSKNWVTWAQCSSLAAKVLALHARGSHIDTGSIPAAPLLIQLPTFGLGPCAHMGEPGEAPPPEFG